MHGKRPSRNQRKLLLSYNLDSHKWYVQKETSTFIQIIHIDTGEVKTLEK